MQNKMGVVLKDNSAKIMAAVKEQVAAGVNEACALFVDEAKANANVDTGFMREHILQTVGAVPARLTGEVRSLAPYSGPQDTGLHGNLFWTRAWLLVKSKFPQLIMQKGSSAGARIIGQAQTDYHGPLGDPRR